MYKGDDGYLKILVMKQNVFWILFVFFIYFELLFFMILIKNVKKNIICYLWVRIYINMPSKLMLHLL